jgi:hypothetical protein
MCYRRAVLLASAAGIRVTGIAQLVQADSVWSAERREQKRQSRQFSMSVPQRGQ